MGKVQGTKPDFEDCFKIYIELLDVEGKVIHKIKFNPKAELSVCRKDGTPTPIMVEFKFKESDPILEKLHSIVLYEMGKDAEYWGGFYGTVFSNERLYL